MRPAILLVFTLLVSSVLCAQEQTETTPAQKSEASTETKKAIPVSPSARLAAAKTAFMKNAAGSEVPFNVISAGIDGWGRWRMVDSPGEADIVIEVYSPDDERTSSSASKTHMSTGGRAPDPGPSNSNTDGPIRLVVSDPRTHLTLWAATEQPKGGFRQRARDEHIIEAAQKLLAKFHDRLEPQPAAK